MSSSVRVGGSGPLERGPGPIPHPADADWRFAGETTQELAGRLRARREIVLLGTPSLFEPLVESKVGRVTLVDRNQAWGSLSSGCAPPHRLVLDDVDATPAGDADVAVLDPPWYLPEALRFLRYASRAVARGEQLWVCWPPEGTRPGLPEEWERFLIGAEQLGLSLIAVETGALRYQTPWFEAQALRAAETAVLPAWRKGDLVLLRKARAVALPASEPRPASWRAARFGFLDLRIRVSAGAASGDPRLLTLVEGDVLPSVSRRHPAFPSIAVWTAGNRVFGCDDPALLAALLEAGLPERAVANNNAAWSEEAAEHIRRLEQLERAEYHHPHEASNIRRR